MPDTPKFTQKGLTGYQYDLENINLQVYIIDVHKGHDTYIVSKECTHIYYVIEGEGIFDIDGQTFCINKGMLIEVPQKVEYTYTGKMKLLLTLNPPWFEGNEEIIRNNPNVL